MELDEWIFAALEACKEKWTAHAAGSNHSTSHIAKMKEKIARQQAQLESQQKQLGMLRSQQEELMLQMEEMRRQSNDSSSPASEFVPQCQYQYDTSSDLEAGVGKGDAMGEGGDEVEYQPGQIIESHREEIKMPRVMRSRKKRSHK